MKTPKFKTIEETFFKGRQSQNFKGIYNLNNYKVKIEIKKDSYDFQSYARVSVFNKEKLEWNFLNSIPYQNMYCIEKGLPISFNIEQHPIYKSWIINDINTLKEKAKDILI